MIIKLLTSKPSAAAASESLVIGLKLADDETHILRFSEILLSVTSALILLYHWHHTTEGEPAPAMVAPKRARNSSRRRR
jgi:hypothetical protein